MASLALQKALRARLITTPAMLALVPAASVIDQIEAPKTFPAIVLGEDFEAPADLTYERDHLDVVLTLNVWDRAPGLTTVKAIADAIRNAIAEPLIIDGRRVPLWFGGARYRRDKDGVTARAVITLETTVRAG